jgi:pimeloyl-ACP methyl ester carboxylesterase
MNVDEVTLSEAPDENVRCLSCCGKSNVHISDTNASPDFEFHADSFIKLTNGITAYRLVDPRDNRRSSNAIPLIVCLHGASNCSYMWADVTDLLTDFEQGPQARVLVFDFYGRGRSPWTGVNITLDALVTQTKELMDCKFLWPGI